MSTQAADKEHRMAPLPSQTSAAAGMRHIEAVIHTMPRSSIGRCAGNYLHAEFRSPLLGFADEVEFYIDKQSELIHFRSSSHVGDSDLGVNRSRMEIVRKNSRGFKCRIEVSVVIPLQCTSECIHAEVVV